MRDRGKRERAEHRRLALAAAVENSQTDVFGLGQCGVGDGPHPRPVYVDALLGAGRDRRDRVGRRPVDEIEVDQS